MEAEESLGKEERIQVWSGEKKLKLWKSENLKQGLSDDHLSSKRSPPTSKVEFKSWLADVQDLEWKSSPLPRLSSVYFFKTTLMYLFTQHNPWDQIWQNFKAVLQSSKTEPL